MVFKGLDGNFGCILVMRVCGGVPIGSLFFVAKEVFERFRALIVHLIHFFVGLNRLMMVVHLLDIVR